MTDYSELKRLAEAAIKEGQEYDQRWPKDDDWFEPELCSHEMYFVKAASPSAVLALIIENEALQKLYAEAWEKARALQSECDEFVRDAERYRWLRNPPSPDIYIWDETGERYQECGRPLLEDDADKAIDAAMSKESPNG